MRNFLLIVFFLLSFVFSRCAFSKDCNSFFSTQENKNKTKKVYNACDVDVGFTTTKGFFKPLSNKDVAAYANSQYTPIKTGASSENIDLYIKELQFQTETDALSVAYEMMAQKMSEKPNIEFGIGIMKKGNSYYLQRMVEGNYESVENFSVSGGGAVTVVSIHNHPKYAEIHPSIGDMVSSIKKNRKEIIMGWDKKGENISAQALAYYPNGQYDELEFENIKGKVYVNTKSSGNYLSNRDICDNRIKDWNNYLQNKGDLNLNGAACPSEGQIKSDLSKQVSQSNGSKTTNYSTVASTNINFDVQGTLDLLEPYKEHRYHVSVEFIKEVKMGQVVNYKVYQCKECGRRIEIRPPETIEEYVARQKEYKDKWDGAVNIVEDDIVEAGKKMY